MSERSEILARLNGRRVKMSEMPTDGNRICSAPCCDRVVYAKQLCGAHYQRMRHGNPLDSPIAVRPPVDPLGRTCDTCGKWKAAADFYGDKNRKDGMQRRCKSCCAASGAEYRSARRANGMIAYETASYRRMRLEVLAAYSGGEPRCSCCDERCIEFLSIDHMNGGGRKHRSMIRGNASRSVYRDLRMHNFPSGFRVLCHNCNQSFGLYGYCPHQISEPSTSAWLERRRP